MDDSSAADRFDRPLPIPVEARQRIDRYAFSRAGAEVDPARLCSGAPVASLHQGRTAGDWAWSILTLGIYTPRHATVTCLYEQ